MPSLKDVRTRIDSVRSTQQITSAMKMVAASKLRKAQNAILTMRPYAAKLTEIMQNISAGMDESAESVYTRQRGDERILIIGIASNRGLCGPFNANVAKAVMQRINDKYALQYKAGNVEIFTIGKKIFDFLKSRRFTVAHRNDALLENLSFDEVLPVAEGLMKDFAENKYDRIEIVYNQFKNAAVQILKSEEFLPITQKEKGEVGQSPQKVDFIFQPSKEDIVKELIPKSLKIQFYKALLDSLASEHGARMTAMHMATDNAQELLKELKLSYNKARQAAITNEILEIVGGAEALNG
ncbi:MAG: ATP synthase F1 subunit gamma [Bacteroidetes bacterium 4484_276]|nr:MAG: ATP synthase F1 subunit gamma [Bacteroidetes bacterium 4484_276]OYT12037.1 MAG: ATP synthase F1 subunit gamma [Bacteroidetes bacterium 4572_114]